MLNWYVLYTKPRCEQQVVDNLSVDGVETYLPLLQAATRRKGRPPTRPFFPCYLFAHLDIQAIGMSRLNWTQGMRHLVMFGGVPAQVEPAAIANIRSHLSESHVLDTFGDLLAPGDRVVIDSGPLQDFQAVFDKRLSAAGRVRVLIYLLQRWTRVEVDAALVRKTSGLPRRDLVGDKAFCSDRPRATQ
jgi:transcriptional antiterminator RfaH